MQAELEDFVSFSEVYLKRKWAEKPYHLPSSVQDWVKIPHKQADHLQTILTQ